eukprot:7162913-Prymnesium_polylepis.1
MLRGVARDRDSQRSPRYSLFCKLYQFWAELAAYLDLSLTQIFTAQSHVLFLTVDCHSSFGKHPGPGSWHPGGVIPHR